MNYSAAFVKFFALPMERVFVAGSLMRDEALSAKFASIGARFCIEARTEAKFRLYLCENRVPPSCGLARVKKGGVSISGEVWKLPLESWGDLLADFMIEPECLAWIPLEEGSGTKTLGFVLEPHSLEGLVDITDVSQGSWRVFCGTATPHERSVHLFTVTGSDPLFDFPVGDLNYTGGYTTTSDTDGGLSPRRSPRWSPSRTPSPPQQEGGAEGRKGSAPGSLESGMNSYTSSVTPVGSKGRRKGSDIRRPSNALDTTSAISSYEKLVGANRSANSMESIADAPPAAAAPKKGSGKPGRAPAFKIDEAMTDAMIDHWDSLSTDRRYKLLCKDVPDALVGKLWFKLSRAAKYRQPGVFESYANKSPGAQVETTIERDVSRTFSESGLPEAELKTARQKLSLVLKAYANYDPSTGYAQSMQGMNFVGAVLLQYMGLEETYWTLVAMMSRDGPYRLHSMFRRNSAYVPMTLYCLKSLIEMFLPKLAEHLQKISVSPIMFATPWFVTLFSYGKPLSFTARCWHLFFEYGKVFLFRFAMGILKVLENELLQMDFEQAVVFLNASRTDAFARQAIEEANKFARIDNHLLKRLKGVCATSIKRDPSAEGML